MVENAIRDAAWACFKFLGCSMLLLKIMGMVAKSASYA
jgi:hypothetical protein